jgi:signal transduction histidine kinase
MIGASGLLSLHQYLYIFIIAVIILVILGIFIPNLYKRLSTRIIALIFVSGPATVIITRVLNDLFLGARLPIQFHLLETALIVFGGPVALGLLAALFVRRPLRQFDEAIDSVEQNNYKVQLQPTGIHEFDEVFAKFNDLMKRLQQEEKLRKDLVSDTSHELNTPLAIMIGQLTAVQEGKYKMTKERVDILKEQAERLEELIQQLGAYTRARIPDTDETEDILLKQFCEELIKRFSLELKQKGITAKLDITKDYMLHANRSVLLQILTNLMQNTLRYSEATELTITATEQTLTFSDNGEGVPRGSLPYLFERFYRVDKSRNRKTGGLGLGLAIVKELAANQGWTITAEAGHPGLTFILKINQQVRLN